MMAKSTVETEIKIRLASPERGREMLEGQGFRVLAPRAFERNTLFDNENREFRARREIIRLREFDGAAILTYKGTATEGLHKTREELEVVVSDYARMFDMLQRFGFQPTFRYEKYRTEYAREGEDGIVMLDETIVGCFLELEGSAEWIDQTAEQLGFRQEDYLTASYGRLYLEWCAERGIEPADMVFGE